MTTSDSIKQENNNKSSIASFQPRTAFRFGAISKLSNQITQRFRGVFTPPYRSTPATLHSAAITTSTTTHPNPSVSLSAHGPVAVLTNTRPNITASKDYITLSSWPNAQDAVPLPSSLIQAKTIGTLSSEAKVFAL